MLFATDLPLNGKGCFWFFFLRLCFVASVHCRPLCYWRGQSIDFIYERIALQCSEVMTRISTHSCRYSSCRRLFFAVMVEINSQCCRLSSWRRLFLQLRLKLIHNVATKVVGEGSFLQLWCKLIHNVAAKATAVVSFCRYGGS